MQRKEKRRNLSEIRDKFRSLIKAAAEKYDELVNSAHEIMPAVYDATRTKSKNADDIFSIDDKHRFREIQREVRRAQKFLREVSSDDYDTLDYRMNNYTKLHRFGGDFKDAFGESYDTNVIQKDLAEVSFDIYHRVESDLPRDVLNFGSENLINAIYDMVVAENGSGETYIAQKQLQLVDYLRELYLEKGIRADKELMHQESEYGLLSESKSAKDFYLKLAEKYWFKPDKW